MEQRTRIRTWDRGTRQKVFYEDQYDIKITHHTMYPWELWYCWLAWDCGLKDSDDVCVSRHEYDYTIYFRSAEAQAKHAERWRKDNMTEEYYSDIDKRT